MPSVAALAMSLAGTGLPVLLPDTCALLDIVRGPSNTTVVAIPDALATWSSITASSPRCALVIASLISKEIADNSAGAQTQLRNLIEDTQRRCNALLELAGLLGHGTTDSLTLSTTLPGELAGRLDALLGMAASIDSEDRFNTLGLRRAVALRRPARHGKVKDAVIVEEYLELSRVLASRGHRQPRVFLTSNTDDFCERGVLHPDLDADFAAAGLMFATKWNQARHLLGL